MNVVPWRFRTAGVGAVLGVGAAHVRDGLRVLPGPRRGPVGTVRLRVLVSRVCVLAGTATELYLLQAARGSTSLQMFRIPNNTCERVVTTAPGVGTGRPVLKP